MIINTGLSKENIPITFQDLSQSPENKTWLIKNKITVPDGEHTLNKITLHFQGEGKLIGQGQIIFNNTTLIANENCSIIDSNISLSGKITNHKVYTDWFGLVPDNKTFNYSDKINQIISIISVGTVYFPKGGFYIGSSIYQKYGVNLEGYRASLSGEQQGTCFFLHENPSPQMITSKCFILLNTHRSNPNYTDGWIIKYPSKETCIKNIYFYNSHHRKDEKYRGYRAILAAGKFLVESCHFDGIDQAVCTNYTVYIDNKMIHDCVYWTYGLLNEHSDLPAFDLSGLGDGLSFIRNSANSDKVLKLSYCMGGLVQNNILHGGIDITNCKNVRIDSNHMERFNSKTQMRIESSQLVISNNFMWKESVPNIVIGKQSDTDENISESIVSLENNNFLYYENEDPAKVDLGCEYDIELSKKASLSISNCYRYITFRNNINSLHPSGIKIKGTDGNDITQFNDKSHLLSKKCNISKGHIINDMIHYTVPDVNISVFQTNTGIKWQGKQESILYIYELQILIDRKRQLKGALNGLKEINISKQTGGILMKFSDQGNYPQGMMLYIKRTHNEGSQQIIKYCLIPVLSQFLYDNGININGFPYKEEPIQLTEIIKSITYKQDNVEVLKERKRDSGTWLSGDIIKYTSDPQYYMSIKNNTDWKNI